MVTRRLVVPSTNSFLLDAERVSPQDVVVVVEEDPSPARNHDLRARQADYLSHGAAVLAEDITH